MQDKKESIDLMSHSSYKKELVKLQELRGKINDAEVEYNRMLSTGVLDAVRQEREQRVIEVLKGNDPDKIDIASTYKADLQKARTRLTTFQQAEEKQKKILNSVRHEVSKKIAKQTKPIYEAIIKETCTAWIELGKLITKEKVLREDLNDNDIAFTGEFTAMPLRLGDPLESNSRFSLWLIDCIKFGYVKPSSVPKSFKDEWERRDGTVIDSIGRGF